MRYYQPGDPLNRVNWAATARTGVLHCKVYDASTIAGVTIVLDFHRTATRRTSPVRSWPSRRGALANAVYLMGQHRPDHQWPRRRRPDPAERGGANRGGFPINRLATHQRVAMREQDDRLRPLIVPAGRGPDSFSRIRELLARVELTDGLTFDQLFDRSGVQACRAMRRSSRSWPASRSPRPPRSDISSAGLAPVSVVLLAFDEIDRIDSAGPLAGRVSPFPSLSDEDELYRFLRDPARDPALKVSWEPHRVARNRPRGTLPRLPRRRDRARR